MRDEYNDGQGQQLDGDDVQQQQVPDEQTDTDEGNSQGVGADVGDDERRRGNHL